ncbi:GntR family transcriptional regulator [bacterium LRH843]|nr:GntR family transcriptional regulator [bacterium LRH843]
MFIRINPKSTTPLYEQIIEQVKEAIVKGIVEEGEKLPSVRDLASQIVLNPNTVSKAYKELERAGVIVTIRGKGTFVAEKEERFDDPREREVIKRQLKRLVIEASYVGVTKEKMVAWVEEEFRILEGNNHAD